ncbi:sigma-70 family RNA polymerase sigma factor [Cryobacterium sp. PH31-L1]|uniref:RNA polymerase sigma factor n=1 Tax=Cryobacterium sp. PH31-L1 TaxID=3046199 RepID=UPI0024BBE4C9|nr:sigma-70 family RNA polymerase sigma factor [Cryobacterium sp. PH31-L1]MDJ0376254.1 sigma-70 family RNA polymerase sigma factor [Cryobacterium sp. PH31-L1]
MVAGAHGNGQSFGVLFDRHHDRVFRYSFRLVRSHVEAEDVTAMVFLEAWRRRARVRLVNGSIIAWLLATATNVARNRLCPALRYQRMLNKIPRPEPAPDHSTTVLDELAAAPARRTVQDAFRGLNHHDQKILSLCVLEELSAPDVGEILGIAPGAVRARLLRAKQRVSHTPNIDSLTLHSGKTL